MLLQCALILGTCWLVQQAVRRLFVKSLLHNLRGPPPDSWLKGNLGQIFDLKAAPFHLNLLKTYGGAFKIYGIAGAELVYFSDPRAMHSVLVKHQDTFEETTMFIELNRMIFGEGLMTSLGDHHTKQRKMLNPVFSTVHIRDLTQIFYEMAHKSIDGLVANVVSGAKTVDLHYWTSRTALEFIGQAGLGYSFGALEEGGKNPYTESVRNLMPTISSMQIQLLLLPFLVRLGPATFRRFLVDIAPIKKVQKIKEMIDIMDRTSTEILAKKKATLMQGDDVVLKQIGQGKDVTSILLRANAAASEEERLPEAAVLHQMSLLIFAAQDTMSSAMSRVLHILCLHPDAQDRLRREVTEARASRGDLSYDEVMSLPYLDAVCRETLRLHPPVPFVIRTARKAVVVPLSRSVTGADGKLIHDVAIAEGQDVMLGLLPANCDPAVWGPDAAEWKPERWLAPLPESVTQAHMPGVYSGMMSFLGGTRSCIGVKFAQLEMKIIFSTLLEKFSFSLPDEEIVWKFGNIQNPSIIGREHEHPHLPLNVLLV